MNARLAATLPCLTVLLFVALSACSTLPINDPLPPTVSVDQIRLGKFTLRNQEVNLRLKVENPNRFDLPLQLLSFTVNVEGDELAKGLSDQAVTIPASGEALLDISLSSSRLFKFVVAYLQDLTQGKTETGYTVTGFVKLANWPQRIPFDVDGVLEAPDELTQNNGG